jgi:2-iminoacetate synthase
VAVPYTGIIMSTREDEGTRGEALKAGVSQISGGSRTTVGGYYRDSGENSAQFEVSDTRGLDDVVNWLLQKGHVPSFCTACYREGRVGDRFMSFAKSGQIANICQANALLTLREYVNDYASPGTAAAGNALIEREIGNIPNERVRAAARANIEKIDMGERDFRF